MPHLISPLVLYGACALGAVGVALALPKRTFSPFIIGALVGAVALGILLIGLAAAAGSEGGIPNFHFYVFSAIALFGAIRVISHPRPVYAALYFILTILASCGLYVLLAAEFMAFALVIVYAGAILITYLFVIMLATEAPSNEALEALNDYDRYSREPVAAAVSGFVLLAALSSVLAGGAATLTARPSVSDDLALGVMPKKIERMMRSAIDAEGRPLLQPGERLAQQVGKAAWAVFPAPDGKGHLVVVDQLGARRQIPQSAWPKDLRVDNVESVAFTLIGDKPGAIEIAGVILLMAMLGAVVLARKKVDLDDAAKSAAMARHLVEPHPTHAGSPRAPAGGGAGGTA